MKTPVSLGYVYVPTAGTHVPLGPLFAAVDLQSDEKLDQLTFQYLPGAEAVPAIGSGPGSAHIFIGLVGMDTTTGAGVLGIIGPGNPLTWAFDYDQQSRINPFELVIGSDGDGEGVLISGWQN